MVSGMPAVVRLGIPLGGFRPARYKAEMLDNTDFRKFGDGLMMTVDCMLAARQC